MAHALMLLAREHGSIRFREHTHKRARAGAADVVCVSCHVHTKSVKRDLSYGK